MLMTTWRCRKDDNRGRSWLNRSPSSITPGVGGVVEGFFGSRVTLAWMLVECAVALYAASTAQMIHRRVEHEDLPGVEDSLLNEWVDSVDSE